MVESDAAPCAMVAFSEYEPQDRSAMIWYLLGDQAMAGTGITTNGVRLLCEHGFKDLDLACIHAMVLEPNAASARLLTKVGFKPAGRLRQAERFRGGQVDRLFFDLLPHELVRA